MLFVEVVATAAAVATTQARTRKVAALGDLFARLAAAELPVVIAIMTGTPRQGRIGVGWRTVAGIDAPPANDATLEIAEVDATLEALGSERGPGSQAARAGRLEAMFRRATADEQDLLRRLLVGELRQGALEGVVTDAIAKASGVPLESMRRAAMFAGDIAAVGAVALAHGQAGLEAIGLTVFRPVAPMLAKTAADVAEALTLAAADKAGSTQDASVEWKLDGARIQVHRRSTEVRIFTRNNNDVTARLPGIVELARSLPAEVFVLDGEAIGVGDGELPQTFQDTMSQFGRRADGAGAALASRFFDILHLDGRDLVDLPLRERLAVLEQMAGPWRIPGVITADVGLAQAILDEAIAAGHEGIMVKAADSRYEAGRRGGAWRKVKPVHTLDLVVLAVEWGSGRRQGKLSNLHLGARDPRSPGQFVMVGKTFKGLTDELLAWQTDHFLKVETHRSDYVVHVRPETVVEIALDGVQTSSRYPGGVALRFARVRRYRGDKSAAEADTIGAVRAMLPGSRPQVVVSDED